ncbi:acetylornithine deacetylase [Alterisphingorhabdus coralli]|uniref:Acetylornithine deacetylase n=1 Tax=Alterisphingorhabdus coralli TaxID=3071408 RepID=A0AA97F885_9SPHN|nr:acetylornithine deacetylase [Parasphingorhabdus sp. SCSIO 66989]WOE74862.1 acetylornithine deacetylase [Parasphingorhabdus sp. SCSIO 66989]
MTSSPLLTSALEILEKLISFDTTSRGSNLELIAWVEDYLAQHGVSASRVANTPGEDGVKKANLFATIGPEVPGGVILSGHSDVVPVDGQPWTSDPWTMTPREVEGEDRLYGRGTADMKGFLALALATVPLFVKGSKPVHLAISYDEEVGCQGAPAMIARLAETIAPPLCAIIGEPSLMQPISGHKGINVYEVHVTGKEAHSSLPHLGVSATMVAVDLMAELRELALALEGNPPAGSGFVPPHATLTIGTIQGGTAANILARECRFTFDLRCPPGITAEEVLVPFRADIARADAAIGAQCSEGGVTLTQIANAPPLAPTEHNPAETLARSLSPAVKPGDNSPAGQVSYAAEAGQFQQAGFPTIICGPGSIEQAHQPDEWIAVEQMAQGVMFMERLAAELGK